MLSNFLNKFKPGERVPPFVAPLVPSTNRIYTKQNGMPYTFKRHPNMPDGWHRFRQLDQMGIVIDLLEPPTQLEIMAYLDIMPRTAMIALHNLADQTWLCLPFNFGDAKQKGFSTTPVPVYLVGDSIESFDLIYANGEPEALIYNRRAGFQIADRSVLLSEVDGTGIPVFSSHEIRTAFMILRERFVSRRLADELEAEKRKSRTVEDRIKNNLEYLGAELLSWRESGNDLIVRWRDRGEVYESRVNSDLSVGTVSAGLCLSGQDQKFDIAAMVDVVREAVKLGRPNAHGKRYRDD